MALPQLTTRQAATTWWARWAEVPDHLRTATQLAALDLPRPAAGPVRATIEIRNPGSGRKAEFDLYDVRESAPAAWSGPRRPGGGGSGILGR